MPWSDVLTLISVAPGGVSPNGYPLPAAETAVTVYANKKSVGFSEFFQAALAGYTEQLKFDVFAAEYAGQTLAEYEGKRYRILRTYLDAQANGEYIELTLSDLAEKGGAGGGWV